MTERKVIQPLKNYDKARGSDKAAKPDQSTQPNDSPAALPVLADESSTASTITPEAEDWSAYGSDRPRPVDRGDEIAERLTTRHQEEGRRRYWNRWLWVGVLSLLVIGLSVLPMVGTVFVVFRPAALIIWGLYGLYCLYFYVSFSMRLAGRPEVSAAGVATRTLFGGGLMLLAASGSLLTAAWLLGWLGTG